MRFSGVVLWAIGSLASFASHALAQEPLAVEANVSGWMFVEDAGGEKRLAEVLDKRVGLIYFWKADCGPCLERAGDLARVATELDSRKFAVVAISLDANAPTDQPLVAPWPSSIPRLREGSSGARLNLQAPVLPHAALVDSLGVVRFIQSGEGAMRADLLKEKLRSIAESRRARLRAEVEEKTPATLSGAGEKMTFAD